MERLGKVKMNYVKPMTSRFEMDKNICDDMCGFYGTVKTSTRKFQQYRICVHFPQTEYTWGGTKKYYSSMGGITKKITITGEHVVSFHPNLDVDCDYDPRDGGKAYGCGWKQYSTSGNGTCHYFGIVKVDGIEITETGSLPPGCELGGW